MDYTKQWLSLDQQIERLVARGVTVDDRDRALEVLSAVGYYRLTGYLYPFRRSEHVVDDTGRPVVNVLSDYVAGTTLLHAEELIDFDRRLRMLVMDGMERIEVAVRMRIGYVLGRSSAFAHEDPRCFTAAFVSENTDTRTPAPSKHVQWLQRVNERKSGSDEQFVKHFRDRYDDRIPVWALTEILEMGHLSRLYQGLNQQKAEDIASAFGVPTKRLMASWLASLNYVRNVAAHHSRLFNRKLQNAPRRPRTGEIPPLEHLSTHPGKHGFGTYNALAVIAYLLRSVSTESSWRSDLAGLLGAFPTSHALGVESMGAPPDWAALDLWRS